MKLVTGRNAIRKDGDFKKEILRREILRREIIEFRRLFYHQSTLQNKNTRSLKDRIINMGCTLRGTGTERKVANQINRKLNSSVVCIDNILSPNTNLGTLSRLGSSKAVKCLKIKIIPEDNSISSYNINLSRTQLYMASLEYTPDYDYIRQTFTAYKLAYEYFCGLVHEICLPEFDISEGIFVFLVSLTANKTASIRYLPSSPYIEVTGEVNNESNVLLQQWKKLCEVIAEVLAKNSHKITKSMKRLEIFIKILQGHLGTTARPIKIVKTIELCSSAIATGKDIIEVVKSLNETIEKFFVNIKVQMKDIQKYANLAEKTEAFTGERIVHALLGA